MDETNISDSQESRHTPLNMMAHGIRLSTPLASIPGSSSLSDLTSDTHSIDAEELMSEDATERKVGDLGQIVRERKLITESSSIFISNGSNINEQVCLHS